HIAAIDAMLKRLAEDGYRPRPKRRQRLWVPSLASLYGQVNLRQENAYLSIGERCNANGSRRFREFQEREDWNGAVEMARDQVKEGSHALDLCTAFVGRDEVKDMSAAITRIAGAVTAPLVVDSTELRVLEAAHKLDLAQRIFALACGKHGLAPSDLLFDPLTFTICTGNDDDRRLGLETLDAIAAISKALPECQIVLGLSNISFGLAPAARSVLNSVFLDEA